MSGCARQWPPSGDASGAIAPPDANPVVPSGAIVALRGPDRLVEGRAGTRDGQGRTRRQRGIGRRERGQKGDAARRLRGRAGDPPLAGRPLNSRCFSLTKPGFAAQPAERAWPWAELGLACGGSRRHPNRRRDRERERRCIARRNQNNPSCKSEFVLWCLGERLRSRAGAADAATRTGRRRPSAAGSDGAETNGAANDLESPTRESPRTALLARCFGVEERLSRRPPRSANPVRSQRHSSSFNRHRCRDPSSASGARASGGLRTASFRPHTLEIPRNQQKMISRNFRAENF